MPKIIFISLPVADVQASTAFYQALGFEKDAAFSSADGACMRWSETIAVMLLGHTTWRSFTQRPFPPKESAGHMLSLSIDSRAEVDALQAAASAHGGTADVNPPEDHGFMYSRDFADPDGHMWATVWMQTPAPSP